MDEIIYTPNHAPKRKNPDNKSQMKRKPYPETTNHLFPYLKNIYPLKTHTLNRWALWRSGKPHIPQLKFRHSIVVRRKPVAKSE